MRDKDVDEVFYLDIGVFSSFFLSFSSKSVYNAEFEFPFDQYLHWQCRTGSLTYSLLSM